MTLQLLSLEIDLEEDKGDADLFDDFDEELDSEEEETFVEPGMLACIIQQKDMFIITFIFFKSSS